MPHYVIELPEGLELLVGVNNYPVDFKIFFPNGKSVDFSFGAAPKPHSSVKVAKGLHEAKEVAEAATTLFEYFLRSPADRLKGVAASATSFASCRPLATFTLECGLGAAPKLKSTDFPFGKKILKSTG